MSDTTRVPLSAAAITALYKEQDRWFSAAELALAVAPAYAEAPSTGVVTCLLEVFTATARVAKFQLFRDDTPLYKVQPSGTLVVF